MNGNRVSINMQRCQGNSFVEFKTELLAASNPYSAFGLMVITNGTTHTKFGTQVQPTHSHTLRKQQYL
jgi:hypothetical protein